MSFARPFAILRHFAVNFSRTVEATVKNDPSRARACMEWVEHSGTVPRAPRSCHGRSGGTGGRRSTRSCALNCFTSVTICTVTFSGQSRNVPFVESERT
jgi:hypothetical protein